MNKRLIAVIAAALLAVLGIGVLVFWAQGAREQAFEGAELKSVVRVTAVVPSGTDVADLAASTEVVELPADSIPGGAVTDLADVQGLSTTSELQPGEVLLEARLGTAGEREAGVDVPAGMQEVAITLDAQRTVAGEIKPGNKVGVIGSFEAIGEGSASKYTQLLLNDVLVTKVSSSVSEESITGLTVTVAVLTRDAERIVFAQEWGRVWLTLQNADTQMSPGTTIQDLGILQ